MEVVLRHWRAAVRHLVDSWNGSHQPRQRRRHRDDDMCTTRGEQRQIAKELERVAEAFLLHHQHRASGEVRQARKPRQQPLRWQHAVSWTGETPVRVLPRLGKSPGVQSGHGPVQPDPPIVRRTCQRLVVHPQRRVELTLDLQHHGEIRPEHRLRRVESDRLAEPLGSFGKSPGLGQCHPHLVMCLCAIGLRRQKRFRTCDRRLPVAAVAQELGQAVAQPRIVRGQRQARPILWLDERRLPSRDQHSSKIAARMSIRAPRTRDAVEDRRRHVSVAARAGGESQQQQRLDVRAVAVEQLAADALGLTTLIILQPGQCGLQPSQPFGGIHAPPSFAMTEAAVSAWVN